MYLKPLNACMCTQCYTRFCALTHTHTHIFCTICANAYESETMHTLAYIDKLLCTNTYTVQTHTYALYMDTHIHSQCFANTLSMIAPCVSFSPPVMLMQDLPTERISCPFNGPRNTTHCLAFSL